MLTKENIQGVVYRKQRDHHHEDNCPLAPQPQLYSYVTPSAHLPGKESSISCVGPAWVSCQALLVFHIYFPLQDLAYALTTAGVQ